MIYLDNLATTPLDPRVRKRLIDTLGISGNPHSDHFAGSVVAELIDEAREQVARLIGALPEEIVFTSGATEANNLALIGTCRPAPRGRKKIVSCVTEHKAVLGPLDYLRSEAGWQVELLSVDRNGSLDLQQLADTVDDQTFLVSIMAANNEIGVLHPISEIGRICRERGVLFHCDAAQAVGKIPLDVRESNVDLLSISAHKVYGPVGVGALFIAEELPHRPQPLLFGGGQENGLRSGTMSGPLCAAFGEACRIAALELDADRRLQAELAELFLRVLRSGFPAVRCNAEGVARLPGCLSLVLPGVDVDHLIGALQPEIAISSTSACTANHLQRSHVLTAMGLLSHDVTATLRVGFGRLNERAEVEVAAKVVADQARRLAGMDKIALARP